MPRELEDWLALESEDWSPYYPFPGNIRQAVVGALHIAQRGLCVYCGCRLDMRRPGKSYHIEHFRPQLRFEELSTDFANLFLSCGQETRDGNVAETCGTAKDNDFNEHCHVEPEYPQCTGRFRFLLNGNAAPHEVGDMAAETMIALLNLNHGELRKDREELLFAIDAESLDITDFIDPASGLAQGYAHVACSRLDGVIPKMESTAYLVHEIGGAFPGDSERELVEDCSVIEFSSRQFPILFRERWKTTCLAKQIQGIDVNGLCAEFDKLRNAAPSRSAAGKRYFVGHDGSLQAKDPDRPSEEHLAIALWNLKKRLPRPGGGWELVLDYQFPLQGSARADRGLGKVDLLGATDQGRLVVVELKVRRARSSRGDAPVLALMEGLRYAAVVHANDRDIAAEARTRFDIEVSDEPPIVQVLGPESWWDGWRDMSASTRRAAGQWEPRFFELSARLEARLGIVIECLSLEGAELEDITWRAHGPRLGHAPKMHMIHRAEGNARDVGPATG